MVICCLPIMVGKNAYMLNNTAIIVVVILFTHKIIFKMIITKI